MAAAGSLPVQGATEPAASTPRTSRGRSVSCRSCSWLNPLIGLALLGATAVHEEQQRAAQQAKGRSRARWGASRRQRGWHRSSAGTRPARGPEARAQPDHESAEVVEVTEVTEVGVVDLLPFRAWTRLGV